MAAPKESVANDKATKTFVYVLDQITILKDELKFSLKAFLRGRKPFFEEKPLLLTRFWQEGREQEHHLFNSSEWLPLLEPKLQPGPAKARLSTLRNANFNLCLVSCGYRRAAVQQPCVNHRVTRHQC